MTIPRILGALLAVALAYDVGVAQTIPRQSEITAGEYFVGPDPGLGHGTALVIPNPSSELTIDFGHLVLAAGQSVYLRFRNGNGFWSAPRGISFYGVGINRSASIDKAEYFLGSDPGQGNGLPIPIAETKNPSMTISSLSLGRGAKVHLRVEDTEGRWSAPASVSYPDRFIRAAEIVVGSQSSSISYGSGIQMTARDGTFNSACEQLLANVSHWNGVDTIWVRAQSSNFLWSALAGGTVLSNASTSYDTRAISFGGVVVGHFKDTLLTISNVGADTLKVVGVASTDASFTARPQSLTIPPSQSAPDTLRFSPASEGEKSGFIIFSSNALSSSDTISVSGGGLLTDVQEAEVGTPTVYVLDQNFPNPFNPTTIIRFGIPHRSYVVLNVYNVLGEKVAELLKTSLEAGYHEVTLNSSGMSTGSYFYRLQTGSIVLTRKFLLLR